MQCSPDLQKYNVLKYGADIDLYYYYLVKRFFAIDITNEKTLNLKENIKLRQALGRVKELIDLIYERTDYNTVLLTTEQMKLATQITEWAKHYRQLNDSLR